MVATTGVGFFALAAVTALITCSFASHITEGCDPDDDRICTLEFDPVCATFKKTFSNQCEFRREVCALAQQGFELVEKPEQGDCCDRECTLEYDPVCSCSGEEFPNKCTLRTYACSKRECVPEVLEPCPPAPTTTTTTTTTEAPAPAPPYKPYHYYYRRRRPFGYGK